MDKLEVVVHPLQDEADEQNEAASISLVDLLIWLGEGKKLICLVTFAAAALAVIYALLQPNIYTARTTLLPPNSQQQSSSAAALAALGSINALPSSIATKTPDDLYINLLKSDSVMRELAKKFDLHTRYTAKTYEVLRKVIPMYVRITSEKKSGVITVEVDDKDPAFAAKLANAYSEEISHVLGRLAISEAQQRRVFFEQQLKDTKDRLIAAEQSLLKVQETSGMIVLDKQAEEIIRSVSDIKSRILEREVRMRVIRASTTADNPDVKLLNAELSALRSELARMELAAPAAAAVADAASSGGKGGASSVNIPVGKLPAAAVDYVRAVREVKFQESMLSSMLRQFEVAKLDEAKESPGLQQVDVALPPDRKSKPARLITVLTGTMLAFIASCAFVIWRRYRKELRETSPERALAFDKLAKAWAIRRKA